MLARLSLCLFLGSMCAFSQGVDLQNDNGVKPNRSYISDGETIALDSGNLNLDIPLLHLPGRAGHDLDLKWHVSSQVWAPNELVFQEPLPGQSNNFVTAHGFVWQRAGQYGSLSLFGLGPTTSGYRPNTNNTQFCYYSPTLKTPDGATYTFQRAAYGCYYVGGRLAPELDVPIVLDDQNAGIVFDGSDPNQLVAYLPDGSMYTASAASQSWVDKNGNVIRYSTNPTTGALNITDTVGRVVTITSAASTSQNYAIQYPGPSGSTLTVNITGGTTSTSDTCSLSAVTGPAVPPQDIGTQNVNPSLVEAAWVIQFPNKSTYTIGYNGCGEPTLITYPTGGYTKYSYSASQYKDYYFEPASDPVTLVYSDKHRITEKDRCTAANIPFGTTTPPTAATLTCSAGILESTIYGQNSAGYTVTTPDGTVTTYRFGGDGGGAPIQNPDGTVSQTPRNLVEVEMDTTSGSRLMQKVVTDLASDNVHAVRKTYTRDDGAVRKEEWDWKQGSIGSYLTNGEDQQPWDPQEHRVFDWGTPATGQPGPLLSRVDMTWGQSAYINGPGYFAHQLLSNTVYSGSSTSPISQTTYDYDQYGHFASGLQTSGAISHGALKVGGVIYSYGAAFHARNNLTGTFRWRNTDGAILSSYNEYDDAGNVVQTQDPLGHITSLSYADQWLDSSCGQAGVTKAYLTGVTNVLSQTVSSLYNSCSGSVARSKDLNSQTTSYYYDPYDRIVETAYPDGGDHKICYSDVGGNGCASSVQVPLSITSTVALDSTRSMQSETITDGLGRSTVQLSLSDPNGATSITTTFDNMDRINQVSNPFVGNTTPVYTTYTYDALGREVSIQKPGGTGNLTRTCYNGLSLSGQPCYSNKSTYSNGSWVDSTDEAGNHVQHVSDGLGRLVAVLEPDPFSGSLSRETDYTYDVLGNLLSATQHGATGESERKRAFSFDSLSRLITSTNPETGTICYGTLSGSTCNSGYDANGNLLSKTDARGFATTYQYDGLNRLTTKSLPAVNGLQAMQFGYTYDIPQVGSSGTFLAHNSIGRLVEQSNSAGLNSQQFSYDALGRLVLQANTVPSECCSVASQTADEVKVAYDLAGNVTDLTYPDGRHIKQTFDQAGRLTGSNLADINGVAQSQTYLQSATYLPDSSPNVLTLGNGVQETITKNFRLQVQSMTATGATGPLSGATFLAHTYCYVNCTTGGTANNGNIWGIADTQNPARTQGFTYDGLNRISSFTLGGAAYQQYGIDSFGNMTGIIGGKATSTFDPVTNRVNNLPCATSTLPFDLAGNQLCTTDQNGAVSVNAYDADSRISQIAMLNSQALPYVRYVYGADGSRIRKSLASGNFTEYVSFNGQPVAEKDQNGGWTDYIYAEGQKIARAGAADNRIRTHGVFTAGSNELRWNIPNPTNANGSAYTVKTGDTICWRQYNAGAVGGPAFWFSNGASTPWSMTDTTGTYINQFSRQNVWTSRCADLTWGGRTTGAQMTPFVALLTDVNTPAGTWDIWYADMAITSTDGSVTPVIGAQPPTPAYGDFQGRGWTVTPTAIAESVPTASDPTATAASQNTASTHFYLSDHLGTAQMEFAAGGWPVWRGQFAPFGGEIQNGANLPPDLPDGSSSHYKFTGKERDSESGLDNFGARYFGSNMGRFMSPDFGSPMPNSPDPVPWADFENPQSLNLYAYGLNNPVTNVDEDGHDVRVCDNNGQCNTVSNDAYTAAQQANNGGLKAPTLDQVGMNGNGSGQFNSTSITDSSGNSVGSATYVSNGGADYYANRTGIDQLAQTGATMSSLKTYGYFYGASALGGAGLVYSGATAGGLTLLGDISLTPTAGEVASAERVLAQGGRKSVERAIRTLSKRLAEHQGKVGDLEGNPGSVEKEIRTFSRQIEALKSVLR